MNHFGFPKANKLCSKKDIEALVKSGDTIVVYPLKIIWSSHYSPQSHTKVAVSVPKKRHKTAVARNLLKRRIREAYRTSQELISFKEKSINCLLIYISNDTLPYSIIESQLKKGMLIINSRHENS